MKYRWYNMVLKNLYFKQYLSKLLLLDFRKKGEIEKQEFGWVSCIKHTRHVWISHLIQMSVILFQMGFALCLDHPF